MTTTRTPQSMTNVAKQTVVLALMGMLLAGVEIYFLVSAVLYRGPSMSVLPGQIAKVLAIAVLKMFARERVERAAAGQGGVR
jgi:hypothetical protein